MMITDPRVRLPGLVAGCFPKALFRGPAEGNKVYLTFDDGPVPEVTQQALSILKEEKVKACFFCVGENVWRHPDIYRQITDEGHKTGNHTYNHLNGLKTSVSDYVRNVEKAAQFIESRLFRPPHGLMKRRQYKSVANSFRIVMWDIVSRDYDSRITPEKVTSNVLKHVRPGSIIVFHDSTKAHKNMCVSLPAVIRGVKERGFDFGELTFAGNDL